MVFHYLQLLTFFMRVSAKGYLCDSVPWPLCAACDYRCHLDILVLAPLEILSSGVVGWCNSSFYRFVCLFEGHHPVFFAGHTN